MEFFNQKIVEIQREVAHRLACSSFVVSDLIYSVGDGTQVTQIYL